MSRYLLDVNVLIALIDPRHVRHHDAHRWFHAEGQKAWASCPLTQLGALRVVGNPRYPNSPGTPAAVADSLRSLCSTGNHKFWYDDLDVVHDDRNTIDMQRVLHSSQLTDTYLLALATRQAGRLATFDRRLVASAVAEGTRSLYAIP